MTKGWVLKVGTFCHFCEETPPPPPVQKTEKTSTMFPFSRHSYVTKHVWCLSTIFAKKNKSVFCRQMLLFSMRKETILATSFQVSDIFCDQWEEKSTFAFQRGRVHWNCTWRKVWREFERGTEFLIFFLDFSSVTFARLFLCLFDPWIFFLITHFSYSRIILISFT